ncbi:hypothetical protein ISN44_As11g028480 [Arabidopsis suecica]|uniref:Uncharacterized protein n=1 Tax=Arabidopsis suecica TaxID=45249 RepID=A0A8T1ZE43_ARASU|nr:hypothetical protein ISN44_As11g028480 [Arabidopsis suecica]
MDLMFDEVPCHGFIELIQTFELPSNKMVKQITALTAGAEALSTLLHVVSWMKREEAGPTNILYSYLRILFVEVLLVATMESRVHALLCSVRFSIENVQMEAKGLKLYICIQFYTIKVTSTKTRSNKLGITKRIQGISRFGLSFLMVLSVWWLLEHFAYFILAEEDKSSEPSLKYWFKCLYTPNEYVLFEDILCLLFYMIKPEKENCITLQDLKASKLSGNVFKVYAST